MTLRPLRISLLSIALLVAAGCSGGTETAAVDDLAIDESGLIATFDVGYEVPLDIPEELQNRNDESADGLDRGGRVEADDPPDGLAMSDDGEELVESPTSDASNDERSVEAPEDPNLRADGLQYVRSPVREDGRWQTISLQDASGEVVWSYEGCDDAACPHDDILVLPNGNVAVTATSIVDGRLVDNVLELEPVIGDGCASSSWCTGVARHSRLDLAVPDGYAGAITLLSAADDYSSWDVLSIVDGSTSTIPAL